MYSKKIGIVCSGGGMKCAYSAGALEALHDYYKFTKPHVLIGASGSAGNCVYFATGQSTVGLKIWGTQLTDGKFISLKKWPIINIDYLVNTVFKKNEPFDLEALRNSSIRLLIPVTNTTTGLTEYISPLEKDVDVYQLLIAAKTIPFFVGDKHCIDVACDDEFVDGDIAQQLNLHIEVARKYGCEKIIVIDNQSNHSWATKLFYKIQSLIAPTAIRISTIRGMNCNREDIQDSNSLIILRPSQAIQMNGFTAEKEKVEHIYKLGYDDVKNNPTLKKLFTN